MEPKSGPKQWLSRLGMAVALVLLVQFWIPRPDPAMHHATRKKVRFWHMWTAEWKDVVDHVVQRFNDSQTEYEVEALSVPSAGADSKFILGVLGGDPPDLMAQWNPVIPTWADDHMLMPLDSLMTKQERETFDREAYPVVKKVGTYKGHIYGMSIGINMMALYYLPEQLRKYGFDPDHPPQTLEELDRMGDRLNRFDAQHNLQRIGWNPNNWGMLAPLFGGGFYDRVHQQVHIDTPENRRALAYIAASRKKVGFDNVVRFTSGLDSTSFAGGWPFIGGAYSFTIDGQWRVEQLAKFAPKLEYRTAPVPPPKGGVPLAGMSGGNFMIVPVGAKNPQGAWEFIKFWSGLQNPNRAAEFYTWGGWLPLTPAVANAPIYQAYLHKYPQFKTFVDLMPSEKMDVLPPVPQQTFLSDHLNSAEDTAARGTVSAAQAARDLQRAYDAEVQRRKELGYGN